MNHKMGPINLEANRFVFYKKGINMIHSGVDRFFIVEFSCTTEKYLFALYSLEFDNLS
jgi:hypothetical protein